MSTEQYTMETLVYYNLQQRLGETATHLGHHYQLDHTKVEKLLQRLPECYQAQAKSQVSVEHRCQARIWNGGISEQCHHRCQTGMDYCSRHGMETVSPLCVKCTRYYGKNIYHKYQWEHLGNINQSVPSFYRS